MFLGTKVRDFGRLRREGGREGGWLAVALLTLVVVVEAVFGGEQALQEGARLGAGRGAVHAEQSLRRRLPPMVLLLLTGIHCKHTKGGTHR